MRRGLVVVLVLSVTPPSLARAGALEPTPPDCDEVPAACLENPDGGSDGTTLRVVDAEGRQVGFLIDHNSCILRRDGVPSALAGCATEGITAGGDVYFLTLDCTGTPHVRGSFLSLVPGIYRAGSVYTINQASHIAFTAFSNLTESGACQPFVNGLATTGAPANVFPFPVTPPLSLD